MPPWSMPSIEAVDIDVMVHVTTTPDLIACQDHFRFLDDRARIAPRRRPRPPQPRMRRAVVWVSHGGLLARLDGTRHRAGGGEQLPVGLLRARGARLLLQA